MVDSTKLMKEITTRLMEGVEVHGGQFIHDGSEYLVNVVNGPG